LVLNVDTWDKQIDALNQEYVKNFKIIHLNINSAFMKISNLNDLFNEQKIDLVVLQESKIDSALPDEFFNYAGYTTIRRDRTGNGGGIIVF
jgi:exonuclease III